MEIQAQIVETYNCIDKQEDRKKFLDSCQETINNLYEDLKDEDLN